MNKEEALEYLADLKDRSCEDVAKLTECISTILSENCRLWSVMGSTILNLNKKVTRVYSAVEIETKYYEAHHSRIIIRCIDKYDHIFSDDKIEPNTTKYICECFNRDAKYEIVFID